MLGRKPRDRGCFGLPLRVLRVEYAVKVKVKVKVEVCARACHGCRELFGLVCHIWEKVGCSASAHSLKTCL